MDFSKFIGGLREYFAYSWEIRDDFVSETLATIQMTLQSAFYAAIIGLALGVLLVVTSKGGILENRIVNSILDKLTNLFRAIPFIILVAVLADFTKGLVGTRIGNEAAIVPLAVSAIPFFAKQVEQALTSIDKGVVEAAQAMGDSPLDIIFSVYFREGLPQLIRAGSITLISLLGLTTMVGTIGGGGIGKLAINVGYNRYKDDVTLISLLIILILVYSIQGIANFLIRKTSH